MTYKQVKEEIQSILTSHAQIREVKFATPVEWIKKDEEPQYPLCCFAMNQVGFQQGYKVFSVQIWFLDLSGKEGEFEIDVVSDQVEIANDIIALLKKHTLPWEVEEGQSGNIILEKFEDFISGIELTINLKVLNDYDTCAVPINN